MENIGISLGVVKDKKSDIAMCYAKSSSSDKMENASKVKSLTKIPIK